MIEIILKYQYFSTFMKKEASVFENQNTSYQYTDNW